MYIKELLVSGFKCFPPEAPMRVQFRPGLNVIVGENGSGKSAIVDSIRLVLREDEYGRSGIAESDFNRPFDRKVLPLASPSINISCIFDPVVEKKRVAFMPWLNKSDYIQLNLEVANKQTPRGHYHRTIWGGVSRQSAFEWPLLDSIQCIYLPPLRDAENQLVNVRGSRLSRLLKNLNSEELDAVNISGEKTNLESSFNEFYSNLTESNELINKANKLIKEQLKDALGSVFSQDVTISFSESDFGKIVESLRILFFPTLSNDSSVSIFRELKENSLGFNNLIYLATILAELEETANSQTMCRVLLIEEPEAHLHPQLQIRLLTYLEEQALTNNIQIIVTSHSPTLASSVSLDSISVLTLDDARNPKFTPLAQCTIDNSSKSFLNRWLDITKSVLLFSKGIILVEGIAEAMLLPELAKIILKGSSGLPASLEEAGVSVINMNGIYFKHFFPLFLNVDLEGNPIETPYLDVRCAGITDKDPPKDVFPLPEQDIVGTNNALNLIEIINSSLNCRLYANMKTFEYDLAMEKNNLQIMIQAFLDILDTDGPIRKKFTDYLGIDWSGACKEQKASVAGELLCQIENKGKGFYAQHLASLIKNSGKIYVPPYIKNAIMWVIHR